ncbi:MAG TPA: hypothetical protein VJT72_05960 [Pseudonocardiaceae bacterium]|nr:hypothetical protein [Pseudonocardiaceae bacterium]
MGGSVESKTGIAVEVRKPKGLGRCRMAPLTDHVAPGARVITDGWQGYRSLDTLGYLHDRRSQRAAHVRGEDLGQSQVSFQPRGAT